MKLLECFRDKSTYKKLCFLSHTNEAKFNNSLLGIAINSSHTLSISRLLEGLNKNRCDTFVRTGNGTFLKYCTNMKKDNLLCLRFMMRYASCSCICLDFLSELPTSSRIQIVFSFSSLEMPVNSVKKSMNSMLNSSCYL